MLQPKKLWLLGSTFLLTSCVADSSRATQQQLSEAISIQSEAVACNQALANDDRYRPIMKLLSLAAPYQVSVAQMANSHLADHDEVLALVAWTHEMQRCRQKVLGYVRQNDPTFLSMLLSTWAKMDQVFVGVIQRRLSLGAAATRLRTIQIDLLSDVTNRTIQIDAQLNTARQTELTRRVAIFDALTNLAP